MRSLINIVIAASVGWAGGHVCSDPGLRALLGCLIALGVARLLLRMERF